MHLLVIDTNQWFAAYLARKFTRAGYTVSIVQSAAEAIYQIDEEMPELIVAEMILDRETIIGLLHELQSHTDLAAIPVVAVTTVMPKIASDILQAYGVQAVFLKQTLVIDSLLETIERLVPTAVRG